jgi:hypothetical protein
MKGHSSNEALQPSAQEGTAWNRKAKDGPLGSALSLDYRHVDDFIRPITSWGAVAMWDINERK